MTNGWDSQQVNVNNAFLNGTLNETVYMRQPEGFENPQFPTHVCKLNKALYGLKQAPRAWFDKLKFALLDKGFKNSISDSSLFIFKNDSFIIYVLVYVDDILITGSNISFIHQLVQDLNDQFALTFLGWKPQEPLLEFI